MGAIQVRAGKGATTFQARIRRVGYPALSKNFPTREAAEQWIMAVEAELDRESAVRAEAEARKKLGLLTFRDLIQRYAARVSPTKKSSESEILRLGKLSRDRIADYATSGLTSVVVAQWRDRRLTEVASDTVSREMHLMSAIISTAQREWGLELAKNPFSQAKKPRLARGRNRRVRDDEFRALLDAASVSRGRFLYPVIQFAVETAMRQGEIVSLDWKHIDLQNRTAYLPETKNGDHRSVPLSLRAMALLRALAVVELTQNRAGPVFPGVTAEAVKRAFRNACKRSGIEDLRFHDLRHEAITRLFEKGLNPIEVALISGHKDMRMLQRYTHLEAAKLARKLD